MERSLVPVSTSPAEVRLAVALFDIDVIARRAKHERDVKDYTAQAIKKALTYKPTLAVVVQREISKSGQLLWEKGYRPQPQEEDDSESQTLEQAVADQMKTYDFRAPVNEKARRAVARSAIRKVAKTFHPDSNKDLDPNLAKLLTKAEQVRSLARASGVSRSDDYRQAEEAQKLLLETMPHHYLQMVRALMSNGQSLAEITTKYPHILPEMEELRCIAAIRFVPETSFVRFRTFEDADQAAARLKRGPEHHARSMACAMVGGIYGAIRDFGVSKDLPPETIREFAEIQDFMRRTFGYVGGTGEFIIKRGDHIVTTRARNIALRLDEAVRALPDKVFSLTEATTAEEVDPEALKQALQGVRYAVADVGTISRDYGAELEAEVNGRRHNMIDYFDEKKESRLSNLKNINHEILHKKFNLNNF